jgi:hypothetical protein
MEDISNIRGRSVPWDFQNPKSVHKRIQELIKADMDTKAHPVCVMPQKRPRSVTNENVAPEWQALVSDIFGESLDD